MIKKIISIILLFSINSLHSQNTSNRASHFICPEFLINYGNLSFSKSKSLSIFSYSFGIKVKLKPLPRYKFGFYLEHGESQKNDSLNINNQFFENEFKLNSKVYTPSWGGFSDKKELKYYTVASKYGFQAEYILLRKKIQPYIGLDMGIIAVRAKTQWKKNLTDKEEQVDDLTSNIGYYFGPTSGVDFFIGNSFTFNINAKYNYITGLKESGNLIFLGCGIRSVIGKHK